MHQLRTIVIGLGKQSTEDHLPALGESEMFDLKAVVDVNEPIAEQIGKRYNVPHYTTVDAALKHHEKELDLAIIAVPHDEYLPIIRKVAVLGIDVVKEKPFATSVDEANELRKLSKQHGIMIYVTLQRRFNPIFLTFKQLVKRIGKIYSIEARYTMNIGRLDEGWRAKKEVAHGGALMDMGYHLIDLLVWYFGLPDTVTCRFSSGNRENQAYDVEDTALMNFVYNDLGNDNDRVLGNALISRVYPEKDESLVVYGSRGSVRVERGRVSRRAISGEEIEILERQGAWPSAAIDQLEEFGSRILRKRNGDPSEAIEHYEQMALVQAAYDSNRDHDTKNPKEYLERMMPSEK